jgi:hypothetical protein
VPVEKILPVSNLTDLLLTVFVLFVVVRSARIIDVVPMLRNHSGFFVLLALLPSASLSLLTLIEVVHVLIVRGGRNPISESGLGCDGLRRRFNRGILSRVGAGDGRSGSGGSDTSGNGRRIGRWGSKLAGNRFRFRFLSGNLGSFGGLKS